MELPVVAGSIATAVFTVSALPMLAKAWRTKDMTSYSPGNMALANIGNGVYTVYVLHLPPGPIWALHLFHTFSTALMFIWYLRYAGPSPDRPPSESPGPDRPRTLTPG